jgi:hypothetical protein
MLALRDLQAAFAAHLQGEDRPELVRAVDDGRRLAIHRHHVAHSLAAALAATFPTVQALVGTAFFRQVAEAYARQSLPAQPVLAEYGAGFADFLAEAEALHRLAYLADTARLDWALNTAFYSPRGARLAAADLAGLPPEQLASMALALAPGTALVRSRYPLDRIWAVSQPGAPDAKVDLEQGPVRLLVLPRADDSGFVGLGEGEAAFVVAVAEGRSLDAAAEAGFAAENSFELASCFARLLACEAFAALQHKGPVEAFNHLAGQSPIPILRAP